MLFIQGARKISLCHLLGINPATVLQFSLIFLLLKQCWSTLRSIVKPRVLQALEKHGSDKDDDDNDEKEGSSSSEEKESQGRKVVICIKLYQLKCNTLLEFILLYSTVGIQLNAHGLIVIQFCSTILFLCSPLLSSALIFSDMLYYSENFLEQWTKDHTIHLETIILGM